MAVATELQTTGAHLLSEDILKECPQPQSEPRTRAASASPTSSSKDHPTRLQRHEQFYMPEGNIVIQVQNTLFRLSLSVLHEHSPVLRNIVPPIASGSLPVIGYNDRRPLVLHEIQDTDFARLLSYLYVPWAPRSPQSPGKLSTVRELLAVLKLAAYFQMDAVVSSVETQLHQLDIEPIRKIAIWDEYHLNPDLLLPSFATLCQRSEPLTLSMTMSLGIRHFTQVAASRDLFRQTVGCCGCRTSLRVEESQAIAEKIVAIVFERRSASKVGEKPML